MRKRTIALGALGIVLAAGGLGFASLDRETRGILLTLPTSADVLQWSQDQRDAGFRGLDRLPMLAGSSVIAPAASTIASAPSAIVGLRMIPAILPHLSPATIAKVLVGERGRREKGAAIASCSGPPSSAKAAPC